MTPSPNQRRVVAACFVLALVSLVLFRPLTGSDFINYDDPEYVTENPAVLEGWTWRGAVWALTANHSSNWHPATWWSHMLDVEMFGLNPGRHHLTNVVLHAASAVLLFLVLHRLTGAFWRGFVVAALFAWHPLHVESVAWISERKDVLSGFFAMLTVFAYAKHVQGGGEVQSSKFKVQRSNRSKPRGQSAPGCWTLDVGCWMFCRVHRWYALALFFFALALMSKPMVVTLPCVLLLLDYWPLRRVSSSSLANQRPQPSNLRQLLLEKLPFFALTLASCLLTVWAQGSAGSVRSVAEFPPSLRLANALNSYGAYVRKTFWPSDLGLFYPYPEVLLIPALVVSGILLAGVTAMAIGWLTKRPYIAVGWFWFLGTLVPVIGIVQAGEQAMADRYSYLPLIGLFIVLVWGAHDLMVRMRQHAFVAAAVAAVALMACLKLTAAQVRYWKDDETLFRHSARVIPGNYIAHHNLAIALAEGRRHEEAHGHALRATELRPMFPEAHFNAGNILVALGRQDEALHHYARAVQQKPDYSNAHGNLGLMYARQERFEEAAASFSEAIRSDPRNVDARYNLGTALLHLNRLDEAGRQYLAALELRPEFPQAHNQLGIVLAHQGRRDQAAQHFRRALELNPGYEEARGHLAQLAGGDSVISDQ